MTREALAKSHPCSCFPGAQRGNSKSEEEGDLIFARQRKDELVKPWRGVVLAHGCRSPHAWKHCCYPLEKMSSYGVYVIYDTGVRILFLPQT